MIEVTDTIEAEPRHAGSKGDARKLRAAGKLPAVVYGPSHEPSFVTLDPKTFLLQRTRLGPTHLYNVAVDGGDKFKALIKDVDRDPVSQKLLHVDLYRVDMTRPMRVEVPIELTGKAAGLIDGGLVSQLLRTTEVLCLPDNMPGKLVADVTPLKVGDALHLSDLVLPEGVKLTSAHDDAVAQVVEPDVVATPAAGEAGAPAAAGAAAAPAAAAAKPAAKK